MMARYLDMRKMNKFEGQFDFHKLRFRGMIGWAGRYYYKDLTEYILKYTFENLGTSGRIISTVTSWMKTKLKNKYFIDGKFKKIKFYKYFQEPNLQ